MKNELNEQTEPKKCETYKMHKITGCTECKSVGAHEMQRETEVIAYKGDKYTAIEQISVRRFQTERWSMFNLLLM